MEKLLIDIIVKWDEDPSSADDYKPTQSELNFDWIRLGKTLSRKDKSLVIKDYMDGVEKVIKKNSKSLHSAFTNYVKDRNLKPDPDSGDRPLWDELVVNNFTIKKIHVGSEYGADFEDDDDIDGFPFQLWPDDGDLGDYIARTVQKGK